MRPSFRRVRTLDEATTTLSSLDGLRQPVAPFAEASRARLRSVLRSAPRAHHRHGRETPTPHDERDSVLDKGRGAPHARPSGLNVLRWPPATTTTRPRQYRSAAT